ncbi:PriCT-2 domain-containing protein [Acinetobacter baumannii]|uniref:VapE domain-containing protein n=1 Tax=Acinetobacter baumannii TaxID=470 RepID=UPI0020CC0DB2|nr:VapE domain-containing protein [Acinetobacter baumannii]MCQ1053705.1 PriCT-2 domain-containing protein [Acinetobacter baumannii]
MSKATYQDLSVDTIIDALGFIDPDQDRKSWARIGMAIKSELGESGFSVFDEWSKGGSKYNKADVKTTWRSIRASKGKDVTIATLIYEAQQGGFAFNDNDRVKISDEEISARKAKREAEERKAAAELKQIRGEVARLANLAWEASLPAYEHPYTTRKGIKIYGARVGNFPIYKSPEAGKSIEPFKQVPALLIPIHEKNGKIVSLQAYFFEDQEYYGDRAYMKDGQKQDGYCLLGTPKKTIAIVEGYATGCSVHEATGWAVMVAFDCGNLVSVAKIARDHFPHAEIIIAGDNDANGAGNKAASEAGQAINGRVILPHNVGDDWNDVHQRDGLEAVQSALMAHLLPKPANDNCPVVFDKFTPFPEVNGNGKPKATTENVKELLRRMGATVRYNVIKKEDEILIPNTSFCVDNNANACIAEVISHCNRVGLPTGHIDGFLTRIAAENQYNPVMTWVLSRQWDGVKRWDEFCRTITPKTVKQLPNGIPLHIALIKRWMLSAIAAATSNGISAQGMLVLQGEQNLGKTRWFKSLVPSELDLARDGFILRPDDKDSVKQAVSYWLIEVGEVDATFKRSDIAALKGFITRDHDELRQAYARKESKFPRRTVFFGSVNPREFLHDDTGNRRYWTIECASVNHEHGFDMQQVWAEIYQSYKANPLNEDGRPSYTPTAEEMSALNASNEEFQTIDPITEKIKAHCCNPEASMNSYEWMIPGDVLVALGWKNPNKNQRNIAAKALQDANLKIKNTGGVKRYLVPRINESGFSFPDENRPF